MCCHHSITCSGWPYAGRTWVSWSYLSLWSFTAATLAFVLSFKVPMILLMLEAPIKPVPSIHNGLLCPCFPHPILSQHLFLKDTFPSLPFPSCCLQGHVILTYDLLLNTCPSITFITDIVNLLLIIHSVFWPEGKMCKGQQLSTLFSVMSWMPCKE